MQSRKLRIAMDNWIKNAGRDGLAKLAIASRIPSGSLSKIRAGREVKSPLIREALARALGGDVSEFWPERDHKSKTA